MKYLKISRDCDPKVIGVNNDFAQAETIYKGEKWFIRREAILSRCWKTEDNFFASRSLDVFISKLRKLFTDDPDVEIKTARGVGLMLAVK